MGTLMARCNIGMEFTKGYSRLKNTTACLRLNIALSSLLSIKIAVARRNFKASESFCRLCNVVKRP
jgi:hypothetical protein